MSAPQNRGRSRISPFFESADLEMCGSAHSLVAIFRDAQISYEALTGIENSGLGSGSCLGCTT
jgi:hypothetical protein